jgi:hypothetical protein
MLDEFPTEIGPYMRIRDGATQAQHPHREFSQFILFSNTPTPHVGFFKASQTHFPNFRQTTVYVE